MIAHIRKCIRWRLTLVQTCQEIAYHPEFAGRSLSEVTTYYQQIKNKEL